MVNLYLHGPCLMPSSLCFTSSKIDLHEEYILQKSPVASEQIRMFALLLDIFPALLTTLSFILFVHFPPTLSLYTLYSHFWKLLFHTLSLPSFHLFFRTQLHANISKMFGSLLCHPITL